MQTCRIKIEMIFSEENVYKRIKKVRFQLKVVAKNTDKLTHKSFRRRMSKWNLIGFVSRISSWFSVQKSIAHLNY